MSKISFNNRYAGEEKVVDDYEIGSKDEFSKIRTARKMQRFYFPIVMGESGAGSWVSVQKRNGKFQLAALRWKFLIGNATCIGSGSSTFPEENI